MFRPARTIWRPTGRGRNERGPTERYASRTLSFSRMDGWNTRCNSRTSIVLVLVLAYTCISILCPAVPTSCRRVDPMCHIGPPTTSSSRSETRDVIDGPLYDEGSSRTDYVCGVGWNRRIGPDNGQLDTIRRTIDRSTHSCWNWMNCRWWVRHRIGSSVLCVYRSDPGHGRWRVHLLLELMGT